MKKPLQILILLTAAISIVAAFFPPLQYFLALSWSGIKNFYFWQLATYIFIETGVISFSFLLQLAFNMYILWIFGSSLMELARPRLFFTLYFGAALIGALAIIPFHGYLAGSTGSVYAILIAWMMVNQGSKLLLFFSLPFKSHWLILTLVAFGVFIDISNGNFASAVSLILSVLFGYFFALFTWKQQGPIAFLHPFEKKVLRMLEGQTPAYYHRSKIYDFKSGAQILDDDQFMDAMLEKISKQGEGSLTSKEKKRMNSISKRKK